jgi:hypothetical protein
MKNEQSGPLQNKLALTKFACANMMAATLAKEIQMTKRSIVCLLSLAVAGCTGYATPQQTAESQMRHAELSAGQEIPLDVKQAENRKPAATFPTGIALARVTPFGRGQFTVQTVRDIEDPDQVDRLNKLPMIAAVTPLGGVQVDGSVKTTQELRAVAAGLHADMVLLYTIKTDVHAEDAATPVSVITLGLAPTQHAHAVTTASAALLDTRTGYVYGNFEATDVRNQLAAAWTIGSAEQQSTNATERNAFKKLVDQFEKTWPNIVKEYANSPKS